MGDSSCANCDQQHPTSVIPNVSQTDPATFAPPTALASPRVVIEFCNRVRTYSSSLTEVPNLIRSSSADGEATEILTPALMLRSETGFTELSG